MIITLLRIIAVWGAFLSASLFLTRAAILTDSGQGSARCIFLQQDCLP